MHIVIAAVSGFVGGSVVTFIYGAWAKSKLKTENEKLKQAVQRAVGKT